MGSARVLSVVLEQYGWDARWAERFASEGPTGTVPGRIAADRGVRYDVVVAEGEVEATAAPPLVRAGRRDPLARPTTGDFVALDPSTRPWTVRAMLPRRTVLVRRAAGSMARPQLCGVNVDDVLIALGPGRDVHPPRLERWLTLVRDGGCRPLVVLTKADLLDEHGREERRRRVREVDPDVEALDVSAESGEGLETLRARVTGRTVALLGASGAGKSSLVNALVGAPVAEVGAMRREGDKGRHTTTRRELFALPTGGVLMDTPGLRELGLLEAEEGLEDTFDDIVELAAFCRFGDCGHGSEPGCAIRVAMVEGRLDAARFARWKALREESAGRRPVAHVRHRSPRSGRRRPSPR
ncbi:MAG: ribosome small subunit-dependent GTPase A [Myxococcota bacterium]|nr:ribosome small subunit-dependent GTPase A [Myxococcota bacterium]MDW8361147.1 ribosome small subunit-dependent GTPase A [Myxococcales bacterium]